MKRKILKDIETKTAAFQEGLREELTKRSDGQRTSVEEEWKEFRDAVKQSAEVTIGYQTTRKAKKPWISEKMIIKMDERRQWKNSNTEEGKCEDTDN